MKIGVFVKRVPDTESVIKIKENGKEIDRSNITFVLNPYDEFAVEEALRIKEKTGTGEVVVVSLGPQEVKETIRGTLAMGADRGIHVATADFPIDPLVTAAALAEAARAEAFDLLLFGKQAVDDDCAQVGTLVAEILGIPSVSVVVKLEVEGTAITAHREVEGGEEVVRLGLPAGVTAQKGLNEPRYASLKGIMAAKKKEIKEVAPSLGEPLVEVVTYEPPPERTGGKIVGEGPGAVDELLRLLREEAKVI